MDIKTIYNMGALAKASYAFFNEDDFPKPLTEKGKGDFTETEAINFEKNFSIKGDQNNPLPNIS